MQTMCRLRVNLDETRLALEDRNNSLEQLQESILEKERVCKCNELMIHVLFFVGWSQKVEFHGPYFVGKKIKQL
jgi:hypothetical protein